jgi:hypothetical protein
MIKNFFTDDKGNLSMGRLISLLTTASGLVVLFTQVLSEANLELANAKSAAALSIIAMGAATKIIQKFAEVFQR